MQFGSAPAADFTALEYDQAMDNPTRQELDAKLAASQAAINARLSTFDASIKTGFADLRAEFANLRAEFAALRGEMTKMQSEFHKNTADLIKWGVTIAIAIVGATVGLLTFINKTSTTPSIPLQAPAPIVIYAQPPAAPAPIAPTK